MTLTEYLRTQEITASEFARRMGVSAQSVHRYCESGRVPRKPEMEKILELTGGLVTPNDFFGVQAVPAAKRRRVS